jgi:hypothetical protein
VVKPFILLIYCPVPTLTFWHTFISVVRAILTFESWNGTKSKNLFLNGWNLFFLSSLDPYFNVP